jgi:acyl-CoA synthetase (AMP-forming)/AMP-acid ligase II
MSGDFASFVDVLQERAQSSPDRAVCNFLQGGERPAAAMTCRELDLRARRIAVTLLTHLRPGDRALLLYPPGLDYIAAFFGCLYAGVVAVPAYPVEPAQLSRTLPRILRIIEDCQPEAVLAPANAWQQAHDLLPDHAAAAALAELRWLATDEPPGALASEAEAWRPAPPDPRRPAYLQYTSGSTGTPKGVMIGHANLVHNSALIARRFGHGAESRGVIWLPPYHDMGLIGGILQPLYAGFPVVLMSHLDFLKHPFNWLRAISKFRGTTSGGPNFAYELLCSIRISAAELAMLDLSCWEVAFTGSEFVRESTLASFAERFAPCGFRRTAFYPCYGMAENTLFATGGVKAAGLVRAALGEGAGRRRATLLAEQTAAGARNVVIGCGRAAEDTRLLVVDPETAIECPDGEEGEIWISGPSVAMGYWRNPILTAETFEAAVAGYRAERFLRTGDLGIRVGDEIFVTGRIKDLIVVRGVNHSPQDLEATVERLLPELCRPGGCAVFAAGTDDEPRVTVVCEMRMRHAGRALRPLSEAGAAADPLREIFTRIRQALSERHGLAVSTIALVRAAAIPRTTSGKIQRHACRALLLEGALAILAEWRAGDRMQARRRPDDDGESGRVARDGGETATVALAGLRRDDGPQAKIALRPDGDRQG